MRAVPNQPNHHNNMYRSPFLSSDEVVETLKYISMCIILFYHYMAVNKADWWICYRVPLNQLRSDSRNALSAVNE